MLIDNLTRVLKYIFQIAVGRKLNLVVPCKTQTEGWMPPPPPDWNHHWQTVPPTPEPLHQKISMNDGSESCLRDQGGPGIGYTVFIRV